MISVLEFLGKALIGYFLISALVTYLGKVAKEVTDHYFDIVKRWTEEDRERADAARREFEQSVRKSFGTGVMDKSDIN